MLLKIRDYFRREKVVSNQQIAREFLMDLQTLQPLLDIWVRKGVIAQCQSPTACRRACSKCEFITYYEYQLAN